MFHTFGHDLQPDQNHRLGARGAADLRKSLQATSAYPSCPPGSSVIVHETHVSWIFLVGPYAYKVKKPIITGFLDYGTLAKRQRCCYQEYCLNRRYAPDLYLGVVPITNQDGLIQMEGNGKVVEYAVKMRRFPDNALLSEHLRAGNICDDEIRQLAETVSGFHQRAQKLDLNQSWGSPEILFKEAIDNFIDLRPALAAMPLDDSCMDRFDQLRFWTEDTFQRLEADLVKRREQGFIRECHGDLHLANVIYWDQRWTPFDGIEFNEAFRWIDVLSDTSFLAMDLAAQNHLDMSRSFINAYLEETGDYRFMSVFRWYLVYRAMVRAKVSAIRSQQTDQSRADLRSERADCVKHLEIAERFSKSPPRHLWITHGVSGSGKTTGTERIIQDHGAIRLRSDIERKRLFGLDSKQASRGRDQQKIYEVESSERTYSRLHELACVLLRNNESVVVDATFLTYEHRKRFQDLATTETAGFTILPFQAETIELRRRLVKRIREGKDASDANLDVLDNQLKVIEPLRDHEEKFVANPL